MVVTAATVRGDGAGATERDGGRGQNAVGGAAVGEGGRTAVLAAAAVGHPVPEAAAAGLVTGGARRPVWAVRRETVRWEAVRREAVRREAIRLH